MMNGSERRVEDRSSAQDWFRRVLRVLGGAAGVVAAAAYAQGLRSNAKWPSAYASGTEVAVIGLVSALTGYLVLRCFFGRFTGLLAAMASAGTAADLFLWRSRGQDMRECAILSMVVACSLFIGIGWMDQNNKPFLKRVVAALRGVGRKMRWASH
jgi:hypothetical protein